MGTTRCANCPTVMEVSRFQSVRLMRVTRRALSPVLLLLFAGCTSEEPKVAFHAHGPNDGMAAAFAGGDVTGHVEVKLHDDKGDLEVWLAKDKAFTEPFDLLITASLEIEFHDVDGRKVTLRPRNSDKNEDENGKANVRGGKTNYFIFPTTAGEDASWLRGKEFKSAVTVRFQRGSTAFESQRLMLEPHQH